MLEMYTSSNNSAINNLYADSINSVSISTPINQTNLGSNFFLPVLTTGNQASTQARKLTDFTIESILDIEPRRSSKKSLLVGFTRTRKHQNRTHDNFDRGKLNNRGPRIPFTSHQIQVLEKKFNSTNYLSSYEVWTLSEQLNISETRVKIWFQNRRARRKREEKLPMESCEPLETNVQEKGDSREEAIMSETEH